MFTQNELLAIRYHAQQLQECAIAAYWGYSDDITRGYLEKTAHTHLSALSPFIREASHEQRDTQSKPKPEAKPNSTGDCIPELSGVDVFEL